MHAVLSQGEILVVEFDGQGDKLEIHFDTNKEPSAVTVLRKRGASLSARGLIPAVLYRRVFAKPAVPDNTDSGMVGTTRPRLTGFFMDTAGVVHCTQLVKCQIVNYDLGKELAHVATLNAEGEVTGEFDYYETMQELENVLGHTYPQLTI